VHHSRRQDIGAVSEDVRERVAQEAQALAHGDAARRYGAARSSTT
jgi:hypothetical protein